MSENPSKKAREAGPARSGERALPDRFWDRGKAGTYLCSTCKRPLFRSSEKIDTGAGSTSFRTPISESDIEYRKIPDVKGQLGIRCKNCHSSIGYVIGGATPHYRLNSIALDFAEAPRADEVAGERESSIRSPEVVASSAKGTQTSSAMNRLLFFLAGATVGIIVGTAGAYYFFQTFYAPTTPITEIATSTNATSTEEVVGEPDTPVVEPEPVSSTQSEQVVATAPIVETPVATSSDSATDSESPSTTSTTTTAQ